MIEHFVAGRHEVLFEAEVGPIGSLPSLAENIEATTTAAWIQQVLDGSVPVPAPVANQLACCLYGCGYADSLNKAKALVAVELGALAAH